MCEQCHNLMQQVQKLLENNIATNRELIAFQRMQIPKLLGNAKLYSSSATTINFAYHMQSQVLLHVVNILVVVGSPAILVIGDRTIPVNGTTVLNFGWRGMLIRPEDLITLTQNVQGPMGLEFLGEELPERGKRW